jgi:hypothetical protein
MRWQDIDYYAKLWRLQGKERAVFEAKHKLQGKELEIALLDLETDDKTTVDYKSALLGIRHKHKEITDSEFEKQRATLAGEPFFRVLTGEYRQTGPQEGTMVFELDWNDEFVEELRSNGWAGYSPDQIVDKWFEDACKQMFDEDVMPPAEADVPVTSYNRTRKRPVSGSKNEYS